VASSRPLDIVARFRTVTTEFNTRQVEKELDDAGRAFDGAGRDAKRWSDDVDRASRNVSRDVKRAAKDGGDAARKGAVDFKEAGSEWGENLSEGLRSGDIVGTVTETVTALAGKFAGTGPIGAALGGLGLLAGAIFLRMQQDAQKAAEAAQGAFDDLMSGVDAQANRQNRLEDAFGKGGFVANLAEAQRIADTLGLNYEDVVKFIVEGNRGQAGLLALQKEYADLLDKNIRQGGDLTAEESLRLRTIEDYLGAVDRSSTAQGKAAQAANKVAQLNGVAADAAERAAKARERDAAASERVRAAIKDAAYYAQKGSSYAIGGSTYNSQVPKAAREP
jgi:hypothetical protein